MKDTSIHFNNTRPIEDTIIKVIGVGGGGSNAIKHLAKKRQDVLRENVSFIICNTDVQALRSSEIINKLPLGQRVTEGRGAGNQPDIGREAANESEEDIISKLGSKTKMIFITAGMGGGTGTGAAPEIARIAREKNILTVAIVTIPFLFEGTTRYNQAIEGIEKLKEYVDTLLVINNEEIKRMYGNLKISEAFAKADDILSTATIGVAEIINIPGHIHNATFADIETVIKDSGLAVMGGGIGTGENRAIDAVKAALNSPLINNNNIKGAKKILINISSGAKEVTGREQEEIYRYLRTNLSTEGEVLLGDIKKDNLQDELEVNIIATGFRGGNKLEDLRNQPEVFVLRDEEESSVKKEKVKTEPTPQTQAREVKTQRAPSEEKQTVLSKFSKKLFS